MGSKTRLVQAVAAVALTTAAIALVAGPAAASPPCKGGGSGRTLIVSNQPAQSWSGSNPRGHGHGWGPGGNQGSNCGHAQYSTIGAAVAAANPGDTVVVCSGTYTEDVVITKPLTLIGQNATINATGLPGAPIGAILGQAPYNGITIESSNVTVKGFTVEGAEGEGILAVNPNPVSVTVAGMPLHTGTPITHVTIENNDVTGNDLGFNDPTSPYVSCTPNGGSDCGEGIHLMSVAYSSVINNKSVANAGGILLTDEFGPNHDNVVQGNYVADNTKDCGITIPSHNLGLNPATGQLDPSFGGVYNNKIIDNTTIDNGVKGYGAGIGIFAPESYTASYNNLVSGNFIEGNGLGGDLRPQPHGQRVRQRECVRLQQDRHEQRRSCRWNRHDADLRPDDGHSHLVGCHSLLLCCCPQHDLRQRVWRVVDPQHDQCLGSEYQSLHQGHDAGLRCFMRA